jgi:hypothetical protein
MELALAVGGIIGALLGVFVDAPKDNSPVNVSPKHKIVYNNPKYLDEMPPEISWCLYNDGNWSAPDLPNGVHIIRLDDTAFKVGGNIK